MLKLIDRMVRLTSGSKYEISDLKVTVVGRKNEGLGDILGSLFQGRRGVIIIGDS